MVLACKADGTPQQTNDLSPLNIHCLRETHQTVKPPFQQLRLSYPKCGSMWLMPGPFSL